MAHGEMIDGVWHTRFHDTKSTGGRFKRTAPKFRNWVTPDGSAGPSGSGGFAAARGRYHLYVSLACPWAHRTVVFRKLKGLEDVISMSVVEPVMGEQGWQFGPDADRDTVNGKRGCTRSICSPTRATPAASRCRCCGTRSSAPSSATSCRKSSACSIRRSMPSPTSAPTITRPNCAARSTRSTTRCFQNVNNGVYRCGFASTQEAYEEAFLDLFGTLDRLEARLSRQRYLAGDRITEADWRLFTTLVRFDAVYYTHFKCNLRRIMDYPNLSNYLRELYQVPGVADDGEHRPHQAALFHEHAAAQSERHRAARAGADFAGEA